MAGTRNKTSMPLTLLLYPEKALVFNILKYWIVTSEQLNPFVLFV